MAKNKRRQLAEINVVPYIDVMLVLLVIFMITTPIITQGVNVDLPEASAEPMDSNDEPPIVITVTADGTYSVRDTGEDEVYQKTEDVIERVVNWREKNPKVPVVIGGDAKTDYGNVVVLMAQLQQAGVTNIGLLTQDVGGNKKDKRKK
jgi:biopolymer transport protein TolR